MKKLSGLINSEEVLDVSAQLQLQVLLDSWRIKCYLLARSSSLTLRAPVADARLSLQTAKYMVRLKRVKLKDNTDANSCLSNSFYYLLSLFANFSLVRGKETNGR